MIKLLIILLVSFHTKIAFAYELKVIKTKGKAAIVILPQKGLFKAGDRISISKNMRKKWTPFMSSKYGITGHIDLGALKYNSSGSEVSANRFNLEARFGFVRPEFEYGPLLILENQSFDFGNGSNKINMTFLGAYGEYNLKFKSESLTPAIGGLLGYTSTELTNSMSGFRVEPYLRLKYFLIPGDSNITLLSQLGYRYDGLSSNGVDITGTGVVLKAGLGYYF